MSVKQKEFIFLLAEHTELFGLLSLVFAIAAIAVLVAYLIQALKQLNKPKKVVASKSDLKNLDYNRVKDERKAEILREMVAPDGVDPGPNNYLIINDGGKDVYVRLFTIASMPKRTNFANTFTPILNFEECTSSIFVKPVNESVISRKMDNQVKVLGSEYNAAYGDQNRSRKIRNQLNEVNGWAEEVESGENKFYSVGWVFSITATNYTELSKKSDTLKAKALAKGITITSCFGVQAEAYATNSPMGEFVEIGSKFIKANGVNYFDMDKYSVSTIFNYTQASFTHKDGIPLGVDMMTGDPIMYDLFDPSHDGFTLVMAGKTGSGKSATIKMFVSRSVLYDYRFVCIDSQTRKGTDEGEFAGVAGLLNGVNFKISNNSDCVLNPFEIGETTKTIKDPKDPTVVREIRTLMLKDKIGNAVNTLLTMIQGSQKITNLSLYIPINRILMDITSNMYNEFGIYEGEPDSLYETDNVVSGGRVVTGRVKKALPTLHDFYKLVLVNEKRNTDPTAKEAYTLIRMALKDFVRDLYYSEETLTWFTKEEYNALPLKDVRSRMRFYYNPNTERNEDVIHIHGVRGYYDGQSNVSISVECPFTNIDISSLSEVEKKLARQVAIDFVNESFIKKNSELIGSANKLVVILDEAHENFEMEYSRKSIDNTVRTARKRHVGIILSSQTLAEYDNWPETAAILKQATTKFVFKQDYQDRDYLINKVGFTEAQTGYILNTLGGNTSDEEDQSRHRGEVCIMDNKQVAFCKVQYWKATEALAVETDAREIEKLFSVKKVS